MATFLKTAVCLLLAECLLVWIIFDRPLDLLAAHLAITPIAFVAAAFANAAAVGGGFLFVPLFIYIYSLMPMTAIKLSLATRAFGMRSGAIGWGRHCIERNALLIGATASMLGIWFGSHALQLPSEDIKPLFGWVSILVFLAVMLKIRYGSSTKCSAAGFAIDFKCIGYIVTTFFGGLITAWTAIAIGELVALYLLFVYPVRMEVAIATGVANLALDSISGFIIHIVAGGIRWDLLVFTAPGVLLGGFFGARAGRILEQRILRIASAKPSGPLSIIGSPLKLLFSIIILVDGASILADSYLIS
jgi:uncharacterized membrane protein YfcA